MSASKCGKSAAKEAPELRTNKRPSCIGNSWTDSSMDSLDFFGGGRKKTNMVVFFGRDVDEHSSNENSPFRDSHGK